MFGLLGSPSVNGTYRVSPVVLLGSDAVGVCCRGCRTCPPKCPPRCATESNAYLSFATYPRSFCRGHVKLFVVRFWEGLSNVYTLYVCVFVHGPPSSSPTSWCMLLVFMGRADAQARAGFFPRNSSGILAGGCCVISWCAKGDGCLGIFRRDLSSAYSRRRRRRRPPVSPPTLVRFPSVLV